MISKKVGRRSKKPTMVEFEKLYSHMTGKELAEYYGVAESTIRKWIREYKEEEKNGE